MPKSVCVRLGLPGIVLLIGIIWGHRPGNDSISAATPPPATAQNTADDPGPNPDPTLRTPVEWMLDPVEVPDSKAPTPDAMKAYTEQIPGTDVTFDMVPIRGGSFLMGSPEGEPDRTAAEGPQRQVVLEPFWMGKCEVTWDEYELWGIGLDMQFRKILKKTSTTHDKLADAITMPSKPYTDMTFGMGKEGYPAICMTQLAAKVYCKWLSAKTGRFYRLPTEAEWEYACRAGTSTAYSFGDDPDQLEDHGWYYDNSDDEYHLVGKKKPNPWGLHDMHGNAAEWVLDQYTPEGYPPLKDNAAKSPLQVPTALYPRVVRGGSWIDDPDQLRSAARAGSELSWKDQDPQIPQSIWYHTDAPHVGFRIVRSLEKPTAEQAARYDIDPTQRATMEEYADSKGGF